MDTLAVVGAGVERCWDVDDVAAFLGLSSSCVYKMVARGAIPHHRLPFGRTVRFRPEEIHAWLTSGAKKTGT